MAKQGKVLPARRTRAEDSLLLRSAESLGRVIGTLQRQLDQRLPRAAEEKGVTATDGHAKSTAHRSAKRAAPRATKNGDGAAGSPARGKKKSPGRPRRKT